MQPVPKFCLFLVRLVEQLLWRVPMCFGAVELWPGVASRNMARQFRRAMRHVEAYLRRVLLVLALQIEPTLVDRSVAVERLKERVRKWRPPVPRFVVLDERYTPDLGAKLEDLSTATTRSRAGRAPPQPVAMAPLYRRLDRLKAIAANPMKPARRLAFWLARRRPGLVIAPDQRLRLPGIVGTEISATFNAMAVQIFEASKHRPPPLDPPRRWGPSVTVLNW